MRYIRQSLAVGLAIVVGILPVNSVSAQAKAPDLAARIASSDPQKAALRLENISDRACQVATTAQGTVAITRVEQHGKTIQPIAQDGAADEDFGYLLKSQLKTLQPGEAVEVALQIYKLKSGLIIRSTTWSPDAGAFNQSYSIQAGAPLKMELNYSLPLALSGNVPACGAVFASNIASAATSLRTVLSMVAALLVIVSVVVLGIWLVRRRRHRQHKGKTGPIAGALLVAAGMASLLAPAPAAHADVVVPPEMQSQFDTCMGIFEANRDITGPGLDILNDPANHVEIVYTTRGSDMTARRNSRGGMDITIYWNPSDRHPYAGSGGNADMCTPLYHEMFHAVDMHNGTFSRDYCAGSGIETKEVMATRAQNALRVRLGMPARSHYGELPLPTGDCSAPANPAQCTGARCGDTNGDPHLRTFDGLRYDFQAAGEFVAARDTAGEYEIQVRQEPWTDSRIVSINTAVASKVGADRVEIRAGTALELLVNGKRESLEAKTLPGGGKLTIEGGVAILAWPDGAQAFVRSVGSYGIAVSVQPADALAGKLEGLLGDANGNSNNDLHARGSTKTIKPTHEELYPTFADSWRINDKDSLFTYESGKTSKSYTIRDFPDKLPDPKSLPGYAAAEIFCKSMGITDPAVLANCALDVAITGRPEFARAAVHSQVFAAGANFGGTTWQLAIKAPGEQPSVTFTAEANQKIFVEIPRSTLPSQCGVVHLFRPDGQEITSGCIINGSGEIDGFVLPEAGTYTLKLSASSGATGSATLRLLRISDRRAAIVPDGQPVTATIDKPGVASYHTFNGQAGQRVYVEIPTSTLPSQCGVVRLFRPDGHELTSGCIINGKGEVDTVVLPDTGQYTIAVDPSQTAVGTARLRLILPTAETKAISMDGSSATATLTKPGSIARLTFDGRSGQRVFVDVPNSSLPSQCGVIDLLAPDGGVITSGCIINGKGGLADDGLVLPTTGRYTLVLNPSDDVVGGATVRLRSR